MRAVAVIVVATALWGCAATGDRNAEPGLFQRAKVMSSNEVSITISHSEWGKPIAFRMAEDHCGKQKKAAVYKGGVMQLGPDMMSTWRCE